MQVSDEIEKYADESDKPALRWLFDRYHWQSEWSVMATAEYVKDPKAKWGNHVQWKPSGAGEALYHYAALKARVVQLEAAIAKAISHDLSGHSNWDSEGDSYIDQQGHQLLKDTLEAK